VSDFVLGYYVPFSKPKTKSDTAHSAGRTPRTPLADELQQIMARIEPETKNQV
jgi:hypothetical protein